MDIDDLKYYKNIIIQKRKEIIETDNFTNWFADKNKGNADEAIYKRANIHGVNGVKQYSCNENDIHSKVKIIQYLLQLDHALRQIRRGNYGTCINCDEKIDLDILEKVPIKRYCTECE